MLRVGFHVFLRRQNALSAEKLHHVSNLNVHHLSDCCDVRHSDDRHCWMVYVDAVLEQRTDVVLVDRNAAVDAQKWKHHFVSCAVDDVVNAPLLAIGKCDGLGIEKLDWRHLLDVGGQ